MKKSNLKEKLLWCGLILILIIVMYIFQVPCLFNLLFKIDCPGCGITRAYISLFHWDIQQAFSYNPMFWAVPICVLIYFFDGKLFRNKWINDGFMILIFSGFFINWILRLIMKH